MGKAQSKAQSKAMEAWHAAHGQAWEDHLAPLAGSPGRPSPYVPRRALVRPSRSNCPGLAPGCRGSVGATGFRPADLATEGNET